MSRPRDAAVATWDAWTSSRLAVLDERRLLRSLRPVDPFDANLAASSESPVRVRVSDATFRAWLDGAHDLGDSIRPRATDRDPIDPASPPSSSGRPPSSSSRSPSSPSRSETPRGRVLRLFSSNDYLGLSAHPAVRAASSSAAARHGSGPRSSALVCGYTRDHRELETSLASLKRAEEALLFPTGFAANLGVIPALADGPDVHVFSDALNHASIVDGCRLAKAKGARVSVYRHADAAHLESLVRSSDAKRKLVVTDTLFSMDGDVAPLVELARVRARNPEVCLMVDEAHATLVMGANGGGAVEAAGIEDDVDVHVGTLSKAFGSHGGFVACGRGVKSLLASSARAHVFSTALPAPAVAAASAALLTCQNEGRTLRRRLWSHVRALDVALGGSGEGFDPDAPKALLRPPRRDVYDRFAGFAADDRSVDRRDRSRSKGNVVQSPIAAVVLGEESEALEASARLLRAGFHVPAIRPPTVPPGTSRLRVALSAAHEDEDVAALCAALGRADAKM